jgi:hypothetical protein
MRILYVLIFAGFLIMGFKSTDVLAQDNPSKGQRAIDLVWDCKGEGYNYQIAQKKNLGDPKFFGIFDKISCASYISGLVDMHSLVRGVFKKQFFCFPKTGIVQEQQMLVFLKWAGNNPERLHESRRISPQGTEGQKTLS